MAPLRHHQILDFKDHNAIFKHMYKWSSKGKGWREDILNSTEMYEIFGYGKKQLFLGPFYNVV